MFPGHLMESEVYIMLYTLNELHERKEVIRELAKKRRKELTVYGGVIWCASSVQLI